MKKPHAWLKRLYLDERPDTLDVKGHTVRLEAHRGRGTHLVKCSPFDDEPLAGPQEEPWDRLGHDVIITKRSLRT